MPVKQHNAAVKGQGVKGEQTDVPPSPLQVTAKGSDGYPIRVSVIHEETGKVLWTGDQR
jgi:hypothetical protein